MQFIGIDNPFGTDAFAPVASSPLPARSYYYKGMKLEKKPTSFRLPQAPKPPSHYLKTLLLANW